jgi:hypothetical protein
VLDQAVIGRHLDDLQAVADANNGSRAAGTAGFEASVQYVVDQLTALGLQPLRQPFAFTSFREAGDVTLTVGPQTWSGAEWLHAMLYSAGGDVAGIPETVGIVGGFPTPTGGCEPSDWVDFTAGHVALLYGGGCFRRDQAINAQNAGAVAMIGLYPTRAANRVLQPTLLSPVGITIPVIAAGQEPAEALLAAAAHGESVQLHAAVEIGETTIDNVTAEIPGSGNDVVMVGGHLDSVLVGPGMNDNGSGVATVLAIAEHFTAAARPVATIRLAFWGGEEFGDLGSSYYVQALPGEERARIRAYINLDMVASPNATAFVYDNASSPAGSDEITQMLLDALVELGASGKPVDLGAGSDHFAFEQAGIPIGGLFSGIDQLLFDEADLLGGEPGVPADDCYHLPCDSRANINLAAASTLGSAAARVVDDLAYQAP